MVKRVVKEVQEEARRLRYYRHNWDKWAEHHIDISLARYRSEVELREWLDRQPNDMHLWCRERLAQGRLNLGEDRSYQAEFLHTMSTPGWYVFRTANGAAKTATAALAILAFLDLYAQSRVLTTAGTWSQLQEQLWREIPLWAARAKLPIATADRIGKTQINLAADWAAFGRGADKASTFEGVHAPNLMVVVDEAKAVPSDILDEAVRRIMRSSEESRVWFIVLSSPGSPSGTFYDMCVGAAANRFTQFHLSAYESKRISLDQIERDADDLGEDSPLFTAMDLGEFPEEADDTVIPMSWAQAAVNRVVSNGSAVLGVDVARFGSDMTALVSLFGRRADISALYNGKDTTWTTGKIRELHELHGYSRIGVDDTGIGGAVTDQCRANRLSVKALNFGSTDDVIRPDRYVNLKAEMYFQLRAEFEAGFKEQDNPDVGLSIPDDRRLIHELTAQRYLFDARQRYRIESHDQMKRRGEKSPDIADALAIANRMRGPSVKNSAKIRAVNMVGAKDKGLAASVLAETW